MFATEARANGRFPESSQILFAPNDPNLMLMRATFGLLVSHDRGTTWDWICEAAVGFSGVEDPMYAVTPSAAILGTTFQGLTVSRDRGCNWAYATGELGGQVFVDLRRTRPTRKTCSSSRRSTTTGTTPASSFGRTSGRRRTRARRSNDSGLRSTRRCSGTRSISPPPIRIGSTSRRIGARARHRSLCSSSRRIADRPGTRPRFLSKTASDPSGLPPSNPTNANRVYLRTSNDPDKPSRLVLAESDPDGGAPSFRTIFAAEGPLPGFALNADGTRIWVGGPRAGIHTARTTDFQFQKRSNIEVQCLAVASDGLWACSNEKSGFVAGLSKDDGATFASKLHFCDIRGPLACPALSSTTDRCVAAFPELRTTLGCAAPSDAGADSGDPAPPRAEPLVARGGYDCQTAGAGDWALFGIVGAGMTALAASRRRRGRRRRP